jgi:uncharacterized membrane protein
MKFSLEFVACFCTAIFAGAALYVSLVEHPARMECGPALATVEFGPSYRRATVMQASMAVVAFLAATGAWWLHAGRVWLMGGVLIGAVAPFTLVVIFPTNKKLLDPSLDRNSEIAERLLQKWGRLHGVRTVLSLAALVIMLWAGTSLAMTHAREQALRQDLFTLRNVIDQYTLDKQKAPHTLDDLVKAGYLKSIPIDPCTGRPDWVPVMEHSPLPGTAPGIVDLDSAARLKRFDESDCIDW